MFLFPVVWCFLLDLSLLCISAGALFPIFPIIILVFSFSENLENCLRFFFESSSSSSAIFVVVSDSHLSFNWTLAIFSDFSLLLNPHISKTHLWVVIQMDFFFSMLYELFTRLFNNLITYIWNGKFIKIHSYLIWHKIEMHANHSSSRHCQTALPSSVEKLDILVWVYSLCPAQFFPLFFLSSTA